MAYNILRYNHQSVTSSRNTPTPTPGIEFPLPANVLSNPLEINWVISSTTDGPYSWIGCRLFSGTASLARLG